MLNPSAAPAPARSYPAAPENFTDLILREGVDSQVVMISPEVAQRWLDDTNHRNRPLNLNTARELARQIEAGLWMVTHQGIAFDTDLMLLDGQHRLVAIALSDQPVPIRVTWNLEPGTFAAIDLSRRRTAADMLRLAGIDLANHNVAPAAIRLLWVKSRHELSEITQLRLSMSQQELLVAIDEFGEDLLRQAVTLGSRCKTVGGASAIAFAYDVLAAGFDPDLLADEFLLPVDKALGITSDSDPRYALRNYILRKKKARATAKNRVEVYATMCRAWNDWLGNKSRSNYRDPSEFVDIAVPRASHKLALVA